MKSQSRWAIGLICLLAAGDLPRLAHAADPWVVYDGEQGPGLGKRIVLISGDEEYRSEEALPQLGKILAVRHGFACTVLFAVDPESGIINPNRLDNIPGLETLAKADLMILFTRLRKLPDDQMQFIDGYLRTGKPVLGIRTATHAFGFAGGQEWSHYGNDYRGPKEAWHGGFGRLVLGEMWISHHGRHKHESTRGVPAPGAEDHPILRGITSDQVWGPSDVYGVRLPLPGDSRPVLLGQVLKRSGEYDEQDVFYGMRHDDVPVDDDRNDPMMPIAWTKTYQLPEGQPGRSFTSTIGASSDLVAEGTRRLLVNAVYWLLGMEGELAAEGANVELVGDYVPTRFEFRDDAYWQQRQMTLDEHRL